MIEVVDNGYYVGIWSLAGIGQDWMCVVWRTPEGAHRMDYRFRYYADPDEKKGFNPFDTADEKNGYTANWAGLSDDEVIAIVDGLVDTLVKGGYCGTRLPWKVRDRRHKNIVRGDGEMFRRVLIGLPYIHLRVPEPGEMDA